MRLISKLRPSTFAQKHANRIAHLQGQIADIACGSGRNLVPFLQFNLPMYAADIDITRIDALRSEYPDIQLESEELDLLKPNLGLPVESFSLVILVHFFNRSNFKKILASIKPNGFLIFETIDDRGDNYLEMPETGDVQRMLKTDFELIDIVEKDIRNTGRQKLKILAPKKA